MNVVQKNAAHLVVIRDEMNIEHSGSSRNAES